MPTLGRVRARARIPAMVIPIPTPGRPAVPAAAALTLVRRPVRTAIPSPRRPPGADEPRGLLRELLDSPEAPPLATAPHAHGLSPGEASMNGAAQQRGGVGEVVVLAGAVVDAVAPATRGLALQTAQLRKQARVVEGLLQPGIFDGRDRICPSFVRSTPRCWCRARLRAGTWAWHGKPPLFVPSTQYISSVRTSLCLAMLARQRADGEQENRIKWALLGIQ